MVNTFKKLEVSSLSGSKDTMHKTIVFFPETLALRFLPIVFQRWPEMAPVGTNPAQFLDWGAESHLVTSFASPGPGWPGIGVMTEDYDKIGTALERREVARELVPISTEESTSFGFEG